MAEQRTKKLYKVEDPADPDRCQSVGKQGSGQCEFLSVKGLITRGLLEREHSEEAYQSATSCPAHAGFNQVKAAEKRRSHSYRLEIWQQRINEFAEDETTMTLRGEIGIIRMMIESLINQCGGDTQQLIVYSQRISGLIMNCERLVTSCDKLESKMSMLLDRSSALSFAAKVVEVISKHITDPEVIDAISNDIITALNEASQ